MLCQRKRVALIHHQGVISPRSGIFDAAPPLKVRDLRLASNSLLVPRVAAKSTAIAYQLEI